MSSEVSIAKPLSGSECLEACLTALREKLSRDDRFMAHMAYSGFRAEIGFKFYPQMTFTPPVEREEVIEKGETSEVESEPTVDEKVELPVRPPNRVREEAGLPQPVLVTESNGQSHEEWVRKGAPPKQGAVPKTNRYKGA